MDSAWAAGRPHVAVVGAGVAGLVCAKELVLGGCDVTLFERDPRNVGGRVATDRHPDGFLLDRGFQILLRSYPEVQRQLDLGKLNLRSFGQGAVLCVDDEAAPPSSGRTLRRVFANPLSCSPRLLPETFRLVCRWGFLATVFDVVRFFALCLVPGWLPYSWREGGCYAALRERWGLCYAGGRDTKTGGARGAMCGPLVATTQSFLQNSVGLRSGFLREFLGPFFEAIYVSPLEYQHPSMFEFVLRMLAVPGSASIPARGMCAVPEQLLEQTRAAAVATDRHFELCLGAVVDSVSPSLEIGEKKFDAVVVSTEWPVAGGLVGQRDAPKVEATTSTTWYFALPEDALPEREQLIVLNASRRSQSESGKSTQLQTPVAASSVADCTAAPRVCNVGFPSVVQRSYAPPGQHLCAVTVMSTAPPGSTSAGALDSEASEDWVRSEVSRLLRCAQALDPTVWRRLCAVPVAFHQPAQAPATLASLLRAASEEACAEAASKIFVCGDWRSTPTLDGAMRSGRLTAERAMAQLQSSS
mmetsp:Transcript_44335/g.117594  ORF Transcript_44335/g.117594 Transcript_44335/m.117594 type:complete len:528 (-) Transcript_44335:297-1880(-)